MTKSQPGEAPGRWRPGAFLWYTRMSKSVTSVDYDRVETLLKAVAKRKALISSYHTYWDRLRPRTRDQFMDVWVFSIMSYLNTWQNNVASYRYVKNLGYPLNRLGDDLERHVRESGCGIFTRRLQSLKAIDNVLFSRHSDAYPKASEPLRDYRSRLLNMVPGLGLAKTSFVIEMLLPGNSEVLCIDRHILRTYGITESAGVPHKLYNALEDHWAGVCRKLKVPCPIARHVVWDQRRGEMSTRYWSYVLEDPVKAEGGEYDVHVPRYNSYLEV